MKIVIDIGDEDLHKAIGQQLDARIAAISDEHIAKRVKDVIETKFGRVDMPIEKEIAKAATKCISEHLGSSYNAERIVKEALASAAMQIIKEKR